MPDFGMLRAQVPIVLPDGRPSPEFYGYLLGLDAARGTDYAAQFQALAARVAALEEGGTLALRGIGSISVRNGLVQLLADEDNLAGNSYYGANAAGERGFWPVADALTAGAGLTKTTSSDGYNDLGELDDSSQLPASANADDAYLIDGDYWVWDGTGWDNRGPPSNSAQLSLYRGAAVDDALLWDAGSGDYAPGPVVRNPTTTTGDLIFRGSGGAPERLPIGAAGEVLIVSGGLPAWGPAPAGGGGGGGCLQFVGEVVLASAASLIEFTGLDSSNAVAWRMEVNLLASAGQTLQSRLRVNGDTGDTTNYNRQTTTANGTALSTARAGNNEAFYTSVQGASAAGVLEIRATPTGALALMTYARDQGSTQLRFQTAALQWVGTGPITALAIASDAANNFAAGSSIRLYKLTATPPTPDYGDLVEAADDAAAAAAGVELGELYRNGSVVMVRVV